MSTTVDVWADYDVALSGVPWPGEWARLARCRNVPSGIFFPGRGEDPEPAKQVCGRCPVLAECHAYVVGHPGLIGVWAGLSGRDRRGLRSEQASFAQPTLPVTPAAPNEAGTRYRTLERLAAHPGRWARVAHYASSHSAGAVASQLRTGKLPAPPGQWRFEGRVNDTGGSDLYALLEVAR